MQKLTITMKLFWAVALFLFIANTVVTVYIYNQTLQMIEKRALARATHLATYFVSMRYIYHQQFLRSGLEINDDTVGFLPAHASTLISDTFARSINDGTTIRNVSDIPRNAANKADDFELEAIEYFKSNPRKTHKMQTIYENNEAHFLYTAPLKVQPYCISCHGKKEEVLPYIAKNYDTAYGYKVGDVRGITSIKMPKQNLNESTMVLFWQSTYFVWGVMIVLLGFIYYVIREFTKKEAQAKYRLQAQVEKKTADLQQANDRQKHLFSILRTVADCNQILITAHSLDELLKQFIEKMYENKAFSGVKVLVVNQDELQVKAAIGLANADEVSPVELQVFETNKQLLLNAKELSTQKGVTKEDNTKKITQLYLLPLRATANAKEAIGVVAIYSSVKTPFDKEQIDMIDELAGDLGFAINSFFQKSMIDKLSFYDSMTNLPNKKFLLQKLSQTLVFTKKHKTRGAILYLNIDNFKSINDINGLEEGDKILKQMGRRLSALLEDNENVFYAGGDEFVVLLEELGQSNNDAVLHAQRFAQDVIATVKDPFEAKEQTVYITLSIGVVLFEDSGTDAQELLNRAESAMHIAKNSGKNTISFYDPKLQESAINRSFIIRNLQEAYNQNQFFMLYQKQVNSDEKVIGVEALIRWKHPELGVVSPATFIPLAEESGFIIELGQWVVAQAVDLLETFKNDAVKKHWRVSVNVSPVQFRDKDFVNVIAKTVAQGGVDPKLLRIELTESVLIKDTKEVSKKLQKLKKLGFSISIDDFGTGYSSLSYLRQMPIDELKIDQSFVFNMDKSETDKTIVETILAMGKSFGYEVVAEGVETKEHFQMLKDLGCKYFQGYHFAKPDPDKAL
jgi:diguanylate cyclase (GGDEF)-like protein